jgi:hypothetical protein
MSVAARASREVRMSRQAPQSRRCSGRGGGVEPMPGDRPRAAILARARRLMDKSAKPALPRSGATLPEAAQKLLSRTQHGYGTDRRVELTLTPGQIALQRKPAHPQVPAGARPPSRRPLPGANPASARPCWPYQRIRAGRLKAQVRTGGRVLEPPQGTVGPQLNFMGHDLRLVQDHCPPAP